MNYTIRIDETNEKYELIQNYKNAFQEEIFLSKYTPYFASYDYIVGDIAYGKLRLKGFYHSKNKRVKPLNNYDKVKEYLKENCAVECPYFILRKIS